MLQLKKDPRFKEKFPDVEEEEEPEITIRLKTGPAASQWEPQGAIPSTLPDSTCQDRAASGSGEPFTAALHALVMNSSVSLYDVLGVTQQASLEDIRQAYRQAARRSHPDKAGQPQAHHQEAQQAKQVQQQQRGHLEGHDASQPLSSSQPAPAFNEAAGSEASAEQFLSVQHAWEVLSDPGQRAEHDRQLALQACRAEVHINEEVALSEMGDDIMMEAGKPQCSQELRLCVTVLA
ncbi:hypothetical protein N2152v2_000374 [Parachlorella kessleri]